MKRIAFLSSFFLFGLIAFSSCSKSDNGGTTGGGGGRAADCSGISPKFSTDVQAIITATCASSGSCHGSGSTNSGGVFTNHTEVSAKKASIKAAILNGSMPKSGSISQAQINAVICWIDAGAMNN